DICRERRSQPAGCFDLQIARKYEEWGRWKEAEQEYIQAGRSGVPCVRKLALAAIQELRKHRPPDESNFELELAATYSRAGAAKEAEQHYMAAGKDRTEDERNKALTGIDSVRKSDNFNVELALAQLYSRLGAHREVEQHYTAAAKDGTA